MLFRSIVNTPVQDPLIDKAKAEKFLIDMYAQNGKVLSKSDAANFVNNKNFKALLPSIHMQSGSGAADDAKIQMIYASLLKNVDQPPQIENQPPEKKKSSRQYSYGITLNFGRRKFFIGLKSYKD